MRCVVCKTVWENLIKTSARESFSLPVVYLYNWMQWHKVLAESVAITSPHCSSLRYSLNIFLPLLPFNHEWRKDVEEAWRMLYTSSNSNNFNDYKRMQQDQVLAWSIAITGPQHLMRHLFLGSLGTILDQILVHCAWCLHRKSLRGHNLYSP